MVAESHTRFYLIDILTTSTARAECIPTDAGRIYVNLDRIVHQGSHEYRSETRHALALSIVRTHTNEAVHAVFTLQVTVGRIALNLHRNRLNAGFIAVLEVHNSDFITIRFGIAHVHSHEHRRPVLTFCTACARINFQDAVHRVFFLTEHVAKL